MGTTGTVYFLVSGRWFSAPDFTGPWTFATPNLPAEFKQIPLEHERSRVLASVPGTTQAAEAILLAQIPQTARVSKTLEAPEVAYQGGTPEFQPIEKTTVQRAVNTDKDILKVGDLYYMCFQGVWFMSRDARRARGQVTGEVPKAIYEIPVSSPSHAVTYVTVEESNNDAVVFATAAAFTGHDGGVGLRRLGQRLLLPAVRVVRRRIPDLLPALSELRFRRVVQPVDRRVHARRGGLRSLRRRRRGAALQPADRHVFARRGRLRSVRRARRGAGVQPAHRRVRRDAAGLERVRQLGTRPASSAATTGPPRRGTPATSPARRRARPRPARAAQAVSRRGRGGSSTVARTGSGDVYAGHDGNVYRKDGDSWQKYDSGGWNNVDQPTQQQRDQAQAKAQQRASGWDSSTAQQVTRDSAARAEGTQRTRDASRCAAARRHAPAATARAAAEQGEGGDEAGSRSSSESTMKQWTERISLGAVAILLVLPSLAEAQSADELAKQTQNPASSCRAGMLTTASSLPSTPDLGSDVISLT